MNRPVARVGWVVDPQVDFMDPDGRLYVKDLTDEEDIGAVQIVETLRRAVAWMRSTCDVVVFTGDWHGMDDEEIDAVAADPSAGTYPPHCMGRSTDPDERAGALIIPEIRPSDPITLAIDATEHDALAAARRAVGEGRPVFIQKNRFDVFTGNTATDAFLRGLENALEARLDFTAVGVARDVCVTQAVDGLQARGYAVTVVSDATWGLGLEPEEVTLERWAEKGRVLTLETLTSQAG